MYIKNHFTIESVLSFAFIEHFNMNDTSQQADKEPNFQARTNKSPTSKQSLQKMREH